MWSIESTKVEKMGWKPNQQKSMDFIFLEHPLTICTINFTSSKIVTKKKVAKVSKSMIFSHRLPFLSEKFNSLIEFVSIFTYWSIAIEIHFSLERSIYGIIPDHAHILIESNCSSQQLKSCVKNSARSELAVGVKHANKTDFFSLDRCQYILPRGFAEKLKNIQSFTSHIRFTLHLCFVYIVLYTNLIESNQFSCHYIKWNYSANCSLIELFQDR